MSLEKHLCLIFTPIDKYYRDALTHFAPPLGLVSIANYVKSMEPNVKITILDGSVTHCMNEIIEFIYKEKPDIVGQSIQLISYKNALLIAKHAKGIGITNVVGGHHATMISDAIAINQVHLIDYVVTGDGEESILAILRDKGKINVPNIVFSENGSLIKTKKSHFDIKKSEPIDYSIISLEPYQKLLKKTTFNNYDLSGNYLRIFSHKGCANRGNSNGCFFCGRADRGVRFKTPDQFWQDISNAIETHGADYIFDVGDDFAFSNKWVSEVASKKPTFKQNFQLGIFGRANRINDKIAKCLANIGVKDVVIGFESFDKKILQMCNKKNTTPNDNYIAAEMLFRNGIDVCASFVLGLIGENESTLSKTVKGAEKIVDLAIKILKRPPREMVANLIEPTPGSPAFKELAKAFPEKYYLKDNLSLEEIQRDYFLHFFNLDSYHSYEKFRKRLSTFANEIHSLVAFSDPQGWFNNEIN